MVGAWPAAATPAAAEFETWVARRDSGVIRQERDFSCGLAALATLLTFHRRIPTSEGDLLDELAGLFPDSSNRHQRGGVSFAELAQLAGLRGFAAAGFHARPTQLREIGGAFIAQLRIHGRTHFTVVTRVYHGRVALADPSWGRRHLGRWEFARLFAVDASGTGRVLVVAQDSTADPGTVAAGRGRAMNSVTAPRSEEVTRVRIAPALK